MLHVRVRFLPQIHNRKMSSAGSLLLPLDDGHYVRISAQADPVRILTAYIILKEQYKILGVRWGEQGGEQGGVGMLDVPIHVLAGEKPYVILDARHPRAPPYGVFDEVILRIWHRCFRYKRIPMRSVVREWYLKHMQATDASAPQ